MSGVGLLRALPYVVLGAFIGLGYVAALGWNVRLYVEHRLAWDPLLIHLLRVFMLIGTFTLCARRGALPLLSNVMGFQLVRNAAVRYQRRMLQRES